MVNMTATMDVQSGSYDKLKEAHLRHDEDTYHENKNIDHSKTHYNTQRVFMLNVEETLNEERQAQIEEFDKNQVRKDRRLGTYENWKERVEKKGSRNKAYDLETRKLMVLQVGDTKSSDAMKNNLMVKHGLSEDEVMSVLNDGLNKAVDKINDTGVFYIAEQFNHLNEGFPHAHVDFNVRGTDKFGKPFTDVNDALYARYGRTWTRETDGKEIKHTKKTLWKKFREEVDEKFIFESVREAISEKLGYEYDDINFVRKETELVGLPDKARNALRDELKEEIELEYKVKNKKLDDKESKLDYKETILNDKEVQLDAAHAKRMKEIEDEKEKFLEDGKAWYKKERTKVIEEYNAHHAKLKKIEAEAYETKYKAEKSERIGKGVFLSVLEADPNRRKVYEQIKNADHLSQFTEESIIKIVQGSLNDRDKLSQKKPIHVEIPEDDGPEL